MRQASNFTQSRRTAHLSNAFDKCQILVAPRVVRDMADHFKAELLVKAGSLEIVSFDHDLSAIPSSRFLLYGTH